LLTGEFGSSMIRSVKGTKDRSISGDRESHQKSIAILRLDNQDQDTFIALD
jgi:hypothetical protein